MVPPTGRPLAGPRPSRGAYEAASVTCRFATADELDRVAIFMRQAAGVNIPLQYLRWRYFDNPAGPSGIIIALDGNQIVGLMSAFADAMNSRHCLISFCCLFDSAELLGRYRLPFFPELVTLCNRPRRFQRRGRHGCHSQQR